MYIPLELLGSYLEFGTAMFHGESCILYLTMGAFDMQENMSSTLP
jgi:hypothetical protein